MHKKVRIKVYGRDQICASCVGAPGSVDTYEWLQAAINRKYDASHFSYHYIDMDVQQDDKEDQHMIEQIEKEDRFYPLVLLNDTIIAEGIPRTKVIFKAIDELGIDKGTL